MAAAEGACEGSTGFSAAGLPTAPDAGVFEAESFSEGSLAIYSSSTLAPAFPSPRAACLFNTPQKTASIKLRSKCYADARVPGHAESTLRPNQARLCDIAKRSPPAECPRRQAWIRGRMRLTGCTLSPKEIKISSPHQRLRTISPRYKIALNNALANFLPAAHRTHTVPVLRRLHASRAG